MQRLVELYHRKFGRKPHEISAIPSAGSNRRYWRMDEVIGTVGTDAEENRAFIALSKHFTDCSLPVPEVIAVSDDGMAYLQTSAGKHSLYDKLCGLRNADGTFLPEGEELLVSTMDMLADFHSRGHNGLDFAVTCMVEAMDSRAVMWDLNYFKYCFLKPSKLDFDEAALEEEFNRLVELTAAKPEDGVMLRDFQSRNVMVSDDDVLTVIDFQGVRRGSALYDLASFLWQSRLGLSDTQRAVLLNRYISVAGLKDEETFRQRLPLFVILRTLQTLAVYGFKGLVEHREMFVKSIPAALANLRVFDQELSEFPELKRLVKHLSEMPRFKPTEERGGLLITVGSFAYKNGIPVDDSGNGGGYVFDCRGIHNPGRYDEYKRLTGRDEPVKKFIEANGDAEQFLKAAFSMVGMSAEVYLRRGFTSLTVWFGCTGGQHRSVYCAERMAAHIVEAFPAASVKLIHREQQLTFEFPAR